MAWTTQKTDAFTGSDGTTIASHDADWTHIHQTMVLSSNRIVAGGGAFQTSFAICSGLTLADDQATEVLFESWETGGAQQAQIFVRMTETGSSNFDGYAVEIAPTFRLVRYDNERVTRTQLAALTSAGSPGDTIRIEAVGTEISVWINGSKSGTLTATDTNHSGGSAGMGGLPFSGNKVYLDDLVIEDDSGGGGTPVSGTPLLTVRSRRTATLLRM